MEAACSSSRSYFSSSSSSSSSPNIRGESIRPSVVVPTPVSRGKGAQHGGDNKGMTLLLLLLLLYACIQMRRSVLCVFGPRGSMTLDDRSRMEIGGERRKVGPHGG